MTSSLRNEWRTKCRPPTWAPLLSGVSDRRPGKKRGPPWQTLTLKAVQATDQATQIGLSLLVAGWLAAFGGETRTKKSTRAFWLSLVVFSPEASENLSNYL